MATYTELFDLRSEDALRNKVAVAVIIKAEAIRADVASTAAQDAWALEAFNDPVGKSGQVLWAVLAANNAATVAQITGATDVSIQTNVNAVVDDLFAK